jgi:hypothetical protein
MIKKTRKYGSTFRRKYSLKYENGDNNDDKSDEDDNISLFRIASRLLMQA